MYLDRLQHELVIVAVLVAIVGVLRFDRLFCLDEPRYPRRVRSG